MDILYHDNMKMFVISTIIFGLVIGLSSVLNVQIIHAITATPKSYNDGVIVGKSECRSGRSYFTDDYTNVLISGYNNNGWQSAGCRTNNSSSDVSALINKATVLYYQGNYTQAIQYYDKALAVDLITLHGLMHIMNL